MVIAPWRRLQIVFQLSPVETFPSGQVKSAGYLVARSVVSSRNESNHSADVLSGKSLCSLYPRVSFDIVASRVWLLLLLIDTVRESRSTSLRSNAAYRLIINENEINYSRTSAVCNAVFVLRWIYMRVVSLNRCTKATFTRFIHHVFKIKALLSIINLFSFVRLNRWDVIISFF